MPEFPDTSESLIAQVRNPSNQAAWHEFEQLYRPVIFRIARAKGLQHADALDLVQQVLVSVAAAIDQYERPSNGTRFRNWLNKVTRNAILKILSRGPRDRAMGGSEMYEVLSEVESPDPETDALISLEYRRELFRRAAEQVRAEVQESTWLAFEMSCLQSETIERTAHALGVPAGSVYAARSRIIRRLRDTVRQLQNSKVEDTTHEAD